MKIEEYTSQYPWLAKIIGFFILFPTIFGSLWTFFDPLDPFGFNILERFGIWGYIALLIVSFLISVIAVIFFIEKPRKSLPKIETELRKEDCKKKNLKPEFFREAGPYWIDFVKGYIHRRDEVGEIINKLKKEPQQVVEGEPASGKSVLLKYIGFDMKKSGYKVFYVDCRYEAEQKVETYLKEACEIDDAKTLIIVDNHHQQIDNCEYFLKQYRNQGIRKTKVLIATRPITGQDKRRGLEIERLNKTEITTQSISQNLINKYLREKFHLSDEEIEDYSTIFGEYERDLWYLSWALTTFKPDEGVIKAYTIYKEIQNSIEKIDSAEDVFLPLSILNRFEIPMERSFLTDTEYGLGIEKQKIDVLIDQNEILEMEKIGSTGRIRVVTLHHSSLAELIFKTCQETPLGENIKNRIKRVAGGFEEGSFLLHYLINSDLIYYINPLSLVFQDHFVSIINCNISNYKLKKKILMAIQYNIDSDKELEEIELYLYAFLRSDLPCEFITELIKELKLEKLAQRINDSSDVSRISSLLGTTQGPFLKEMVKKIDLENLKSKVTDDIWTISGILGSLANTDINISRDFTHQLGISHIRDLFSNPEYLSIEEMGRCYGMLAFADDNLTNELLIVIKTKFQERLESMNESVDEIPDSPSPMLNEIMNLIREAAGAQDLFGNHYTVIDKLFDGIEELIIEKIHEAKWGFVDISGGDMSESEALDEITQGIKEELQVLFGHWNKEFLRKTLARFEITSTK